MLTINNPRPNPISAQVMLDSTVRQKSTSAPLTRVTTAPAGTAWPPSAATAHPDTPVGCARPTSTSVWVSPAGTEAHARTGRTPTSAAVPRAQEVICVDLYLFVIIKFMLKLKSRFLQESTVKSILTTARIIFAKMEPASTGSMATNAPVNLDTQVKYLDPYKYCLLFCSGMTAQYCISRSLIESLKVQSEELRTWLKRGGGDRWRASEHTPPKVKGGVTFQLHPVPNRRLLGHASCAPSQRDAHRARGIWAGEKIPWKIPESWAFKSSEAGPLFYG